MNEREFSAIFQRNFLTVYRVCFIYMKNHAEAEDCTENVFVKLLCGDTACNNEQTEKAVLCLAAMDYCSGRLKKWNGSAENNDSTANQPDGLTGELMKLPEKLRQTVVLHSYAGASVKQISELMKLPEKTVEKQLKKAQEKLRKAAGGVDIEYAL